MKEHGNKLMSLRSMMKKLQVGFPTCHVIIEAFWKKGQANGRFMECTTYEAFRTAYVVIRKSSKE